MNFKEKETYRMEIHIWALFTDRTEREIKKDSERQTKRDTQRGRHTEK